MWQPQLVDQFGFRAVHASALTALTSLFLHVNVLHLLGNMVFVATVGASVELATGSIRFMVVYFASGLAGILLHFLIFRHSLDAPPLIGASGAIAGCAGYYAVRYTHLRVPVGPHISASIFGVSLLWLCLQAAGAFIRLGDTGAPISYWAHLGGFAAGVLVSFVFRAPDVRQEFLDRQVLDAASQRGPAAEAAAARRHLERHPRDMSALLRMIDVLDTMGESEEMQAMLLRALDLAPKDQSETLLVRLVACGGVGRLPVSKRVEHARELVGNSTLSLILWRSVASEPHAAERAEALFAVAELCAGSDEDASTAAAKQLTAEYPEHPAAIRARARGLVK